MLLVDIGINGVVSFGDHSYFPLLNTFPFVDYNPSNTSTEAHTTDNLKSTWVVALSVVVLVCLLIGGVIVYKRRSIKKWITMITKTDNTIDSDVEQKHGMLDMKQKVDNDSGIITDDENGSIDTQTHDFG